MNRISWEAEIRHVLARYGRVALCLTICGLAGWAVYTRWWEIQ